uniref:JmjC domain-containing protein n=1 Tax=Chromera velia CCMP2878 TaxID=1169474 RepID=A0A0G4HUX1_9ALVE|eukprot:Cvel_8753.t1-p1 / transcript=Cvel_8753.t1 / gene=Cvel_8753 / organism=Chromera_velia_CCMP2878 / gene_product=hypothetical protein / transcript_product=hypothetical protein / location=Cvel_scaffold489:63504-65708(+) / protein_length=735 / sequence_SO=supercontig / SO=protein_coding / is_pseudo=false
MPFLDLRAIVTQSRLSKEWHGIATRSLRERSFSFLVVGRITVIGRLARGPDFLIISVLDTLDFVPSFPFRPAGKARPLPSHARLSSANLRKYSKDLRTALTEWRGFPCSKGLVMVSGQPELSEAAQSVLYEIRSHPPVLTLPLTTPSIDPRRLASCAAAAVFPSNEGGGGDWAIPDSTGMEFDVTAGIHPRRVSSSSSSSAVSAVSVSSETAAEGSLAVLTARTGRQRQARTWRDEIESAQRALGGGVPVESLQCRIEVVSQIASFVATLAPYAVIDSHKDAVNLPCGTIVFGLNTSDAARLSELRDGSEVSLLRWVSESSDGPLLVRFPHALDYSFRNYELFSILEGASRLRVGETPFPVPPISLPSQPERPAATVSPANHEPSAAQPNDSRPPPAGGPSPAPEQTSAATEGYPVCVSGSAFCAYLRAEQGGRLGALPSASSSSSSRHSPTNRSSSVCPPRLYVADPLALDDALISRTPLAQWRPPRPETVTTPRIHSRWLLAGSVGTGSDLHEEPEGTGVWVHVVTGGKRWLCFPPSARLSSSECPVLSSQLDVLGSHEKREDREGKSEWQRELQTAASRYVAEGGGAPSGSLSDPSGQGVPFCLDILQGPGETLVIPPGWWHLVVNVDTHAPQMGGEGGHSTGMRNIDVVRGEAEVGGRAGSQSSQDVFGAGRPGTSVCPGTEADELPAERPKKELMGRSLKASIQVVNSKQNQFASSQSLKWTVAVAENYF